MNKPWFDAKTGWLLLDEYAAQSPSFRNILADGVVTDSELAEQGRRVVTLLQTLDQRLPADLRELATETLTELAVLNAVKLRHDSQQASAIR